MEWRRKIYKESGISLTFNISLSFLHVSGRKKQEKKLVVCNRDLFKYHTAQRVFIHSHPLLIIMIILFFFLSFFLWILDLYIIQNAIPMPYYHHRYRCYCDGGWKLNWIHKLNCEFWATFCINKIHTCVHKIHKGVKNS